MRKIASLIFLLGLFMLASCSPPSDESKYWERDFGTNIPFRAYKTVPIDFEIPVLPSYLASAITNGITLGQIVAMLGHGWMCHTGPAVITWRFSDGRWLHVISEHCADGDVLMMYPSFAAIPKHKHSQSFMWFYADSTNSLMRQANPLSRSLSILDPLPDR